jgi:hypothetical protein
MKKMLLAGCSHSVGFGLENVEDSWGNIFAKNNGYELTNIAKAASSIQYSVQGIIDNISKENFDLVILQLTTFDRYPIPFDGTKRYLGGDIGIKSDEDVFHLVPANYLESIDGKNFPVKCENIRHFFENVTYSSFYLNTIINEIYLLQELLKYKNVRFILIPYDDHFWGNTSYMSIWRFDGAKKINKTDYIDYPFMKWLKDNHNPSDYYIDNGFHLNSSGHKLFAENYLTQLIKW